MQIIQQLIGKLSGTQIIPHHQISVEEKELLSLSLRMNRKMTPKDVCTLLNIKQQKARKLLHNLLKNELLVSGGKGEKRINCYLPHPNFTPSSIGL